MSSVDTRKWMPLHIGPYERATNRLSLAEDGAYMRLLRDYWVNGAPPDDDAQIARILRVERREWAKIRPAIVRFFDIRDGHWFQERMEEELAKARAITEARRAAGQKGGKGKSKPEAIATDVLEQSETHAGVASPSPSPPSDEGHEDADASFVGPASPVPTAKAKGEPWLKDADFGRLWALVTPQMRSRAKSKEKAWPEWKAAIKHRTPEQIIAATEAYLKRDPDVQRTGGPGLHIWLRDGTYDLWTGDATTPSGMPTPSAWSGPAEVVSAVTAAGLAASYLRSFTWDEHRRAIVSANGFAVDTVRKAAGRQLEALGVRVLLEAKAA